MASSRFQKTSSLHKRKKRQTQSKRETRPLLRLVLVLFALGMLGSSIVYGVNRWEYVHISDVKIKGAELVEVSKVKKRVEKNLSRKRWRVLEARALPFVPAGNIEAQLQKNFPSLREVTVHRTLPDTLTVTFTEKEPVVTHCAEWCYQIDKKGIAMARVSSDKRSLPRLEGKFQPRLGEQVLSEREAKWLYTLITQLSRRLDESVTRIVVKEVFQDQIQLVHAFTEQGYYVKVDSRTDVVHQVGVLRLLFAQKLPKEKRKDLKYIDIRVKNRVYYQ